MGTYVVHASVKKYDFGLGAETMANVNGTFQAKGKQEAEEKAVEHFREQYNHPKVGNVKVEVVVVNQIS